MVFFRERKKRVMTGSDRVIVAAGDGCRSALAGCVVA
jgi:hypothetical protein